MLHAIPDHLMTEVVDFLRGLKDYRYDGVPSSLVERIQSETVTFSEIRRKSAAN